MSEVSSAAATADAKVETRSLWTKLMDVKISGIIPLPLFALGVLLVCVMSLTKGGMAKGAKDLSTMIVVMFVFGTLCGEIGKRIPVIGKMGAAAICATFIPSAAVYYGWLPTDLVQATTSFYKATNILYLYICCVIVGSIMSMDRATLVQGFFKIFVPMIAGAATGMLCGTLMAMVLGKPVLEAFFFLVLPCMAGGVGEGAIPLSIGLSEIPSLIQLDQGEALGRVLPIVMLSNLTAILLSGLLNMYGKKREELTGNGRLIRSDEKLATESKKAGPFDPSGLAAALMLATCLYVVGVLGHRLLGLPAPIGMLFAAVVFKLCHMATKGLVDGALVVYKFFATSVTYPILYAVGVAITPWEHIIHAFTLTNIIVIWATVIPCVTAGFFVSRMIGMYPVDTAIISCCQCGQGGTGDVAILTAGNRMELMPFAQIATRIGGAINVTVSLIVLAKFFAA